MRRRSLPVLVAWGGLLEHVAGDRPYGDGRQHADAPDAPPRTDYSAALLRTAPIGLTRGQAVRKRAFDVVAATSGLILLSWLIAVAFVAATVDTRAFGFFRQDRVGRHGRIFRIVKVRSMRRDPSLVTSVTTARDPRITRLGRFWRRTKIDELPQLWNVLRGEMSLVGPRPEVPGFADLLTGTDASILTIRPGITGPATLHFRDEEQLLALQDDPEEYNRTVLFPAKVQMNLEYIRSYSFRRDLALLWRTFA